MIVEANGFGFDLHRPEVMLKINRAQTEFWDQQVVHHEGEKTIDKGGFILQCGVDIRDLIEDPQ